MLWDLVWISEACWMLLWFVYTRLVRRVYTNHNNIQQASNLQTKFQSIIQSQQTIYYPLCLPPLTHNMDQLRKLPSTLMPPQLLLKVFCLSGLGDGATLNNKTLMNSITHGTHNTVAVCDIFDCNGHMEWGNTKNSKFISDFMKGMVDDIYPRN